MQLNLFIEFEEFNLCLFIYDIHYWTEFLTNNILVVFAILCLSFLTLLMLYCKKIKSVNSKIFEATKMEHERLGMILHDELNPLIAISKIKLESIIARTETDEKKMAEGKQIVKNLDKCIRKIRSFSHYLAKDFNDNDDFNSFVRHQCTHLQKDLNIRIDVSISPDFKIQSGHKKNHLSKIIFELIQNSFSHGEANFIRLYFYQEGSIVHFHYHGNDKGFNLNDQKEKVGLGISLIYKRVKSIKGKIAFLTQPGLGTDVKISFSNRSIIFQTA